MRIFFKIWSFRGSLIKVLGRRQRPDVRRAECGCTSTNVCCHLDTFSFRNSNWCWIWGGRGRIRPFGCAQIWWHSCQLGKWQGRSNPIDTHYCPLRILIKFQSTRRTRVQASGLKHEELTLNCSQCNIRKHCSESFTENAVVTVLLIFFKFAQHQDAELKPEILGRSLIKVGSLNKKKC